MHATVAYSAVIIFVLVTIVVIGIILDICSVIDFIMSATLIVQSDSPYPQNH